MGSKIQEELSIVTSADRRGYNSMSQYCNWITMVSSLSAGRERKEQMMGKKRGYRSDLAEINAKARQQGMSYGKYVGMLYSEEQTEMDRRRRYEERRREQLG